MINGQTPKDKKRKKVYIGFENEANHYQLYYGEVAENNDLKIRKGNGALRRLLTMAEQDPTVSDSIPRRKQKAI